MSPRAALVGILAANAISLWGNVLAALAIPWFVLTETGSALQTGVAALFVSAPLALGAFFGGAITDRIGARTASVAGDVASAISVAGIPLLHLLGILEFWQLLLLAFLGSLFDAPAAAAREALLPDLTTKAGWRTERVTSGLTATEHGGYLLAAPLGGLLIALFGAPALLWIDAATFLLAAGLVLVAGGASGVARVRPPRAYVSDLIEGLRYIRRERAILTVTLAATGGAFFIDPLTPVLLPIYANSVFGDATALGLAVGAYGVGGLLGIGVFSVISGRWSRRAIYRGTWLAYALASFALVALPPLLVLLPVLVVIGITVGAIDPLERAVRQERVPPELRGRVFSAMYAIPKMVVPLGVFTAGLLVQLGGLRAALLVFAIGNLFLALLLAIAPGVSDFDSAREAQAARRMARKAT